MVVRSTTCSLIRLIKRTCFLSSTSTYSQTSFVVDHSTDYVNMDMAPFDTYSLTALAFVIERATNRTIPTIISVADWAPNHFDILSYSTDINSSYTYDSGSGPTTIEAPSRMVYIQATRSLFSRTLIICLFLVNWALTIGSIYITLIAIFREEGVNEAVFLLPITIILTIPTLRSLYPGSLLSGIYIGKCQALVLRS